MTKSDNSKNKDVNYYIMKFIGGYKTLVVIGVFSAFLVYVISHRGMTESWAWELASSLITINGVILGFTIVGMNLMISEKLNSASQMSNIIEKQYNDFVKKLTIEELEDSERVRKKFEACLESSIGEIISKPSSIAPSMYYMFGSILSALLLFGVNDVTVNNFVFQIIFNLSLIFSISLFIFGVFLTIKHFNELIWSFINDEIQKAFEKSFSKKSESS